MLRAAFMLVLQLHGQAPVEPEPKPVRTETVKGDTTVIKEGDSVTVVVRRRPAVFAVPPVPPPPPSVGGTRTSLRHVNMEQVTPADYEALITAFPKPQEQFSREQLADLFVNKFATRPDFLQTTFDEYNKTMPALNQVATYIWTSKGIANHQVRYCTIHTNFGRVYVTCKVDRNGRPTRPAAPVEIHSDSPSVERIMTHTLSSVARNHPELFPEGHVFNPKVITHPSDLDFLFGRVAYKDNITQYL